MAAPEKRLGELHEKVAEVLIVALDGEELPGWVEENAEGEEVIVPARRMLPSAAIIAAATKFLKDNEITCAPSEDNTLGQLQKQVEEKRNRRADRADRQAASSQAGFLNGLPN